MNTKSTYFCRVCERSFQPKESFILPKVPISTFEIKSETTDLKIVECDMCHAVQLINNTINTDYLQVHRSLNVSSTYRQEKKNQFNAWMHQYGLFLNKKIFEVGSGNGQIVQLFHELGKEIDHYPLGSFNINRSGFDGIICFYILEHQPEPIEFLQELYNCLNDDGVALIEVPNYDVIEKKGLWLEFTPDHLVYYRKSTLIWLLNECNFQIEEISESANDGLCLSIVVRKPKRYALEKMYYHYQNELNLFKKLIREIQKPYAIYGAGHYTQVLINQLSQDELPLKIYDGNKQKCWYAIRNITIVHKEHINGISEKDVKTIIVNCGGYNQEVFEMLKTMNTGKELIVWQ